MIKSSSIFLPDVVDMIDLYVMQFSFFIMCYQLILWKWYQFRVFLIIVEHFPGF